MPLSYNGLVYKTFNLEMLGSTPTRGTAMFDIAKAVELCENENKSKFKSGVHARFYDLGDGWGVKYFLHEEQRNQNFDKQSELAKLELAPDVGVKFQFTRSDKIMYGFFTKVVIPYEEYYDDAYSEESDDRIYGIAMELQYDAEENGIMVRDLHEGNIGWDEEANRWLIIDCSVDSCERDAQWNYHGWDGIE